jgi:hypothetical protein
MCIKMRRTTLVVILTAASLLATPDLNDQEERAAVVRKVIASRPIALPALSVARVVWAGDVAVVQ